MEREKDAHMPITERKIYKERQSLSLHWSQLNLKSFVVDF